jgi:hypothetical protein
MATKMTAAQKNTAIKENAVALTVLPEDAIQVGDFSYAIPVTVDGELRYAVVTYTAKNNKDTKTTEAFNPERARADWLADKEIKAQAAAEKAAEKERKAAARAAKKSKTDAE